MACLSVVSFGVGMVFLWMGAWPVFGFLGLDVFLVWLAFRANFRAAKAFEEILVTPVRLVWRRVSARGFFDPPAAMLASGGEFKSQNNPFSDFARLYLQRSAYQMVTRHDLLRIFNAWHKAEYGGREWTGKAVAKALKGVMDGVIGDDTNKARVWLGIRFAEAVQPYNQQAFGEAQSTVEDLNKGIPHDLQIKHGIAQPRTRF